MKHHSERICLAGAVLQLVFALACFLLTGWNNSSAIYATAWLTLFGTVFWLLTYIHLWAGRIADEEEREEKEFERRRGAKDSGKLFEERKDVTDAFSARTKLRRIEKWFFPVLSLLLGLGMVIFSYLLLSGKIGSFEYGILENHFLTMALLGSIAFFSFILSRYTSGLAEESESRGLKTCSGAMFSVTAATFLIAIAFVLSWFGYPGMEWIMFYISSAVLGLVGVEMLLSFITHFYRPRVEGRVLTPVYYSKILGLIATPRSIFRATAITLDYQFGFKVSETWFYQFFERAAAPLVLFLLLTLYLFSSIVIVQSDEEVIVERFGAPRRPALKSGLHLKLPWPFDNATRYSKCEIKEMIIGIKPRKVPPKVLVWINPHHEEEYQFIVAQKERTTGSELDGGNDDRAQAVPVNFLSINIRLQYHIKDVFDYAYNKSDPDKMLEELAYRELVRYCATADYNRFLGEGRPEAEQIMIESVTDAIDTEKLGIELLSVNILDVHPPVETVKAFEGVIGAMEEKEAKIWEAGGTRDAILNAVAGERRKELINAVREYDKAISEGDKAAATACEEKIGEHLFKAGGTISESIQEADSERYRLKVLTQADSESFKIKMAAFNINPEIYMLRFRLNAMVESMVDTRKYIIPANTDNSEVFILDFQEKALSPTDIFGTKTKTKQ